MPYVIGIFSEGKLLFPLIPNQPNYKQAAFAVDLVEAFIGSTLRPGDYVACEEVK